MRTLLVILGVIALLLLLGGAVNADTEVSLDYVAGSTAAVSLFWVALVAAAGLVLAGIAGWAVARAGDAGALRKLERELEATYRRLRDCEAKLPKAVAPVAETATLVAPVAETATLVAPVVAEPAAVVVAEPAEDPTVVVAEPAEDPTVVVDAEVDAGKAEPATAADADPATAAPAGDEPAAGESARS